MHTREVFISLDVVFHENIFPFNSIYENHVDVHPFLDLVLPMSSSIYVPFHEITSAMFEDHTHKHGDGDHVSSYSSNEEQEVTA